ncbi:collagen-like protein [Wolbachia endosymbiont of Ctenocephalides felis wCfeT]|uniref:collagen-like protein n=1 Tax=Wolbachia endosymbiont of Ctenocephalides felis wCfeT TaxID=2732593 RepID=UPI001444F24D|nr:collagen-like protein [Wolbachia endosymbiont of Ctenocephalides felis wCfeT]
MSKAKEGGYPGTHGRPGEDGEDGVDGQPGQPGATGEQGERGPRGYPGTSGRPGEDGKDGADGQQGEMGPQGPRGQPGEKGEKGEISDFSSIIDANHSQKKSLLRIIQDTENQKKAKIVTEINGQEETVAKFLEVGHFFKNDDLYIRNHITGSNILIPKDFHFLKVIKDDLQSYKLAFCNNLGNLFFEHKKYDPEYTSLPKEYKSIDLQYMKNAVNIDLSKYYYHTHTPLFAIKRGEL